MNRRLSMATYFRFLSVSTIAAYVLGRPMPLASSALMSVASEYRAGGFVNRWFAASDLASSSWPSSSWGSSYMSDQTAE